MQEKVFSPEMRFSEFLEKWEVKLLESIANRGSGHTPSKSHSHYYGGQIPWISLADSNSLDQGVISETKYQISEDGLKNSSAVLHPKGSVLLSRDAGVGKSALMGKDMAVSQHFIVWQGIHGKLHNRFLYYKLQILKREFERIAIGSTIKTIGLPYFKKLKIVVPSFIEQQKIASFLTAVDTKIEQLTQKVELLQQYKKGVMQQLFSQKLRFKDDEGKDYPDWEERVLGDLCKKAKSGGTPKSTKKEYYNGDIPFLAISDMTSQGKYLCTTSKSISQLGIDNSSAWLVPANSLIYSMYASVGFVSINKIALTTSQAVMNMVLKDDLELEFVYYALIHFQNKVHRLIETGTQGNLNAQTVKAIPISIPCQGEQTKIANFLSAIDAKIELVQTQLENTQQFKKGLLQQMFV